jgi:branched-chain amino acid transport system ATP-binding protein
MFLEAQDLVASYGKLRVLRGVTLGVEQGEVVLLIGRNGSGKSTTLKAIFGLTPLETGRVRLDGADVTGERCADKVRRGLALVPQTSNVGRGIFSSLTIEENLDLGAYSVRGGASLAERKRKVYELFPALEERRRVAQAGLLSGGQQQMLAVGIALMAEPKALLLDEPTSGLSPAMGRALMQTIRDVAANLGTAILLVEQNVRLALEVADRVYAFRGGRIGREGTPESVLAAGSLLEFL